MSQYCHIIDGLIVHTSTLDCDYFRKLTGWGNPERMTDELLREFGVLPKVVATLADGQKHGAPIIEESRVFVPAVAKTVEDIKVDTYVPSITQWQLRKWLNANQMRTAVDGYVANSGDQDMIDGYAHATEYLRDNPLVVAAADVFAPQFEMTTENFIHKMFWEASQL